MNRFAYTAYDSEGRQVSGEIVSGSRNDALQALHRRGTFPFEIRMAGSRQAEAWWQRDLLKPRRMVEKQLAVFMRELAQLASAALPIDECLRIIVLQPMMPARLVRLSRHALDRIQEGEALSQALASYDVAVPEHVWRLVEAGESGGDLPGALSALADSLERRAEVRQKIVASLTYPAFLVVAAVISLLIIAGVLLPSIVPVLNAAGAPLPPVIAVMEATRRTVVEHTNLVVIGLAVATVIALFVGGWHGTRRALSLLALKLPGLHQFITQRETARFTGTIGTLLRRGVPMLDAIRIAGGVMTNARFRNSAGDILESVRRGGTLTESLVRSGLFPELAVRLVSVGERSGQLATMLERTSQIFEFNLQRRLDRLTALLTPVLTIVMGMIVGGLIISVMSALLSINSLAVR